MKPSEGRFCQRVGALIEKKICETYSLTFNKRQRSKGYYDAYDKDTIYEIKASLSTSNRIMITENNHKTLTELKGKYIFVLYTLKNTDKELTVRSDITIEKVVFMDATELNSLMLDGKVAVTTSKIRQKTIIRIRARHVLNRGANSDKQ